jgi:uncharacterized membrane protein YuzA (DUF378 family)
MNIFEDRLSGVWDAQYFKKLIYKWAMFLVLIGAVNWLLIGIFGVNMVRAMFGNGALAQIIYTLIGVCGIILFFQRDVYLPFLGESHVPCGILENREPPGATKSVRVVVAPYKKVIYWAAEPATEDLKSLPSWKDAYKRYENAGVATANAEGVAVLKVRSPQSYKVPFRGALSPHVHYRVCEDAGWMGRVNTVHVDRIEEGPEGFEENVPTAATTL